LNNGVVLVAGGYDYGGTIYDSAELYDPNFASRISNPTGNLNGPRVGHTATLLNNGMVLIVGGRSYPPAALTGAEPYNPATGTFTATGNLNIGRGGYTATLLKNGMVLIAGGVAPAELYNPATGLFTLTGNMNHPTGGATATLLNNGMVLIAAIDDAGTYQSEWR
jgi:hypothetical protein